jgi:hypothetical protein
MTDCPTCRRLLAADPGDREFTVTPAHGGGWHLWSAALLRLLGRIGDGPTHAVVVTQPSVTDRYVQAMVGHGVAYAEASANTYLTGPSRLSGDQEDLLGLLGWQAPSTTGDDGGNWHLPVVTGDWLELVEMLLATMVGIFGFDEHHPVVVSTFVAAAPCRACSWPDEPATRVG